MFHVFEERKGFQYAAGILGFWDGKYAMEGLKYYTDIHKFQAKVRHRKGR